MNLGSVKQLRELSGALDHRTLGQLIMIVTMLVGVGAYYLGPKLEQRLSRLPVLGNHSAGAFGTNVMDPRALPAALGVPLGGAPNRIRIADGRALDEIFSPPRAAVEEVAPVQVFRKPDLVLLALDTISLDALAPQGAFIAGRFYRVGDEVDSVVLEEGEGTVSIRLAVVQQQRVLLKAGVHERWVRLQQ